MAGVAIADLIDPVGDEGPATGFGVAPLSSTPPGLMGIDVLLTLPVGLFILGARMLPVGLLGPAS